MCFLVLVTTLLAASPEAKEKQTQGSAMRSTCLTELDGRPWLLSMTMVRLLILPHQVWALRHPIQGNSTAGPVPASCWESRCQPRRASVWRAKEVGLQACFQQVDAGPSRCPSLPGGGHRSRAAHSLSVGGRICKWAGKGFAVPPGQCFLQAPLSEKSVLPSWRRDSGGLGEHFQYSCPTPRGWNVPFLVATKVRDTPPSPTRSSCPIQDPLEGRLPGIGRAGECPGVSFGAV